MISGTCTARFEAVSEAFRTNFEQHGEVGASVCVTIDGETVVDLWGGTQATRDPGTEPEGDPWTADTMVTVFSCTKGAVALAAHVLADRGELDLNRLVSDYWPSFAAGGKADATVRMLLDHTVGVPSWREKLTNGEVYDFDAMAARCAAEEAFWQPGTQQGYHMLSFGWLIGEVIRRVSGMSLGAFLREAVAEPAGADFWLGVPEAELGRVSRVIPFMPDSAHPTAFTHTVRNDRKGVPALALLNQGGMNPNSSRCHTAEIGGGGGVSSARGLAQLYRRFATGEAVSGDTLGRMGRVAAATERDAVLGIATRFGLGFMTTMDNRSRPQGWDRDSCLLGEQAFGHVGAGGSIGFCDPLERLSVGYVMNRMGSGVLLNERGQGLVDAIYRSLGYQSNQSGAWRR
ncbi:MAG: serine hydrolase domain-containing protein [Acidimicrobiales bacterium]